MKKLLCFLMAIMMLSLVGCGATEGTVENSANELAAVQDETAGQESEASADSVVSEDAEESMEEAYVLDEPLVLVKQITNDNAYGEYYYDETGRIMQELTYFKGELSNCYVYNYTEQEDGTTLLRVMNDVPYGAGYEYFYDTAGNCVKFVNYFSGNTDPEKIFSESFIQGITEYEYDENNRLITRTYMNPQGDGTVYTYEYDEKGQLVYREESGLQSGTVLHSDAYVYDENGYVIQKEVYSVTYGESVNDYEWSINYDTDEVNIINERERNTGHELEYEYTEDGKLWSITVDDRLTLLPDEIYISNGKLVSTCENCRFVLMPLSQALAMQNSTE